MSGTKEGGRKAALTNRLRHGDDFYATIGRKGGCNGRSGGFASNVRLASEAGRKGGSISRRGRADKEFWDVNGDNILKDYELCGNMKEVAKKYNKEYASVRRYIKENE